MVSFPVSGVETEWWIPLLTAFVISAFTSTAGVSGAFLLLPFQMSVLGFIGPGVSPTNLIYNIVAIPGGVYRYWREKRLVGPLVKTTVLGTLPGVFLGAVIRIKYMPDTRYFKFFVGLVLLYIGIRLGLSALKREKRAETDAFSIFEVKNSHFNLKSIGYEFQGENYSVSFWGIFLLSLIVGLVGGIYGIGGGAIIAPFLIAIFGLPVYTVAGAALLGTFITSIAGVIIYTLLAPIYQHTGLTISPDWALGGLFGIGGALGVYVGARFQRRVPARLIKLILTGCILFVSLRYIWVFLLRS